MKNLLDWSVYKDAGIGDAYADTPRSGGNFAKAVAVCINSMQCEQSSKGVMCPSYRVSKLHVLSTGGRVRLLKAALNGGLGEQPFQDRNLTHAMELCVGCKGCKRECENEVDMAMIKVEYLAQHYLHSHIPLRTRVLSNLSFLLQYYACFKTLVKWRNRSSLLKKLTQWTLGLSEKRHLPEPVKMTYTKLHETEQETTPVTTDVPATEVVLLIDTFTDNFSPQTAKDAIAVLSAAGYKVHVTQPGNNTPDPLRPLCCGRTHIANGLIEQAKVEATRMLSVLLPHVEAGRTIIGLEPACLLAIRDDYKFLGMGQAASKVADRAILFEEFVAREVAAKRFELKLKPVDTHQQPLMIHGHCHQKAVGAMKSMRKVLKLIPELDFKIIDSSCCGMAGSFGIEQEHAEMAMQMAELSLLPALREHNTSRIVANGFSCQHQIKEGVNRSAVHVATILREALA